jgi:hypothetical protein
VVDASLSEFLCKRGFGDNLGAVSNTAPGFFHIELQSRCSGKRCKEFAQIVPQNERALSAFASLEIAGSDGLKNLVRPMPATAQASEIERPSRWNPGLSFNVCPPLVVR